MACLENPIKLYFYWNSPIRYDHGGIPYFGGRAQKHWIIKQKIQHSELVDKICHLRGIDKSVVRVTITLRHPTILKGSSVVQYFLIELDDDDAMDLLWHMPDEFKLVGVQVLVEFEDITTTHTETCTVQPSNGPSISPNITPTVNLGSFTSLLTDDWPLHSPPFETEAGRVETDEDDPNQTLDADGYPSSEGPNEDELHVDEDDGDEIDEEIFVPSSQNLNCGHTSNFGSRISDPCSNVSINMQRWSEDNFELRLGMRFIDKVQATYAVRKWSVVQGREFTVVKSKSKIWTAECKNKTREHPCNWYIRIISRQSHVI